MNTYHNYVHLYSVVIAGLNDILPTIIPSVYLKLLLTKSTCVNHISPVREAVTYYRTGLNWGNWNGQQ